MNWHVITTKPRRELAVAARLCSRWQVYLPFYTERIGGRRKVLIPGYVFAQCDQAGWKDIPRATSHVTGWLHSPGQDPHVVPDWEIEQLKALESAGAIPAVDALKPGDQCEVMLRGAVVPGRYVKGNGYAVVMVEILGRWLTVRVSTCDVRRVA